jgi:acyl-coenzyme A synthetase/AMP-(fatty) acid ligase
MTSQAATDIAAALAQPTGSLTDGTVTMTFPAIAASLAEIAETLDHTLAPGDCVAFACDNSVASAIVLLALIVSGRSFVLLPGTAGAKSITAPVPETFSRFTLRAGRRGQVPGAVELRTADIALTLAARDLWQANLPPGPASYFLPTSGSTGPAKLVRHAHDRFLSGCRSCAERLGLSAADRIAVPVPLAHMYGLRAAFAPGLIAGAAVDLQANANALRYLAREADFDPTVAFLTPSFSETLLALRKAPRPYRLTVMAGDSLPADLFDRHQARHGCVVNLYGSTELGAIAVGDPDDPPDLRRSRIGRLLPDAALCAAPPDAPDADVLWLRHDGGFLGYVDQHGQALRSADGFLSSGDCYCSGDLGSVADGYLSISGRADDRVKRDGIFVTCAEVTAALRQVQGMQEVAVFAGDMTPRGRALVAFCAAEPGQWDPPMLRRAAKDVLPPHAIPDHVFLLPDLPRLASGKIDRQNLRRRYASRET